MTLNKDDVRRALRQISDDGASLDREDVLLWVTACDAHVALRIRARAGLDAAGMRALAQRCAGALGALASLVVEFVDHDGTVVQRDVWGAPGAAPSEPQPAPAREQASSGHQPLSSVGVLPATRAPTPQGQSASLPGVSRIIAVGAGKGGVGKSTIAVNLAVGLARRGRAVGLLDGDIYGPSLPTLLGLGALEQVVHQGRLQPFLVHGIKAITIGKLVDPEKALIWRGPMAHGAFKQLAEQTAWGELDDLIVDLPPGTGDVALTMAQTLKLTGAVIVCTPQRVAQDDAVRATRMFQQLGIEVLGVVENMSYFIADDVEPPRVYDLFGRGGAEVMAQRLNVPFLGAVPLTVGLRRNSDAGDPSANFAPRSSAGLGGARPGGTLSSGVSSGNASSSASSPQGAASGGSGVSGGAAGVELAGAFERLVDSIEAQAALASLRRGAGPQLTIR